MAQNKIPSDIIKLATKKNGTYYSLADLMKKNYTYLRGTGALKLLH